MFHFTGYRVSFPILFRKERHHITGVRLPHSEIAGSKVVCTSPTLIAAYHVLHRLSAPRHSLYALNSLIPVIEIEQTGRVLKFRPAEQDGWLNHPAKFAVEDPLKPQGPKPPESLREPSKKKVELFQELQDKLK